MGDQVMSVADFFTYKEGYHIPVRVLKEFMEELREMEVRPDDIFIATFPKSGTHWMQEIVNLILFNGNSEKIPSNSRRMNIELADVKTHCPEIIAKAGPYLRKLRNAPSPRVLPTHASYDCLPKDLTNTGCKVIYVYRNPKDVIVSYYNHRRRYTKKDLGKSAPHSPLLFDDFLKAMTTKYSKLRKKPKE
ncbi:Sulfotransferase family cytosolic 1B member 1 [Holothuria leucospilota]|uniref:Sulfotransferase family cytosolic 1B member 1 n=1 Tax=Holothuria leucospilota TaxID=206669 RepID=A0A9Q1BFH4_HOLLE|nr:Sulfotransferase family cytosolic 1B member 1 [Holothuria leucospilota]